jgi:hypothetical protein
MLTRVRSGVRPCPQLLQNAVLHQGHSPLPVSFWTEAANLEPRTSTPLFRQLAQLCILKYDLEQKALPSYLRLQVLDLTACVGIRLDFLPASSARHISKLVLDRSDVRKVPVGMSRLVELSHRVATCS